MYVAKMETALHCCYDCLIQTDPSNLLDGLHSAPCMQNFIVDQLHCAAVALLKASSKRMEYKVRYPTEMTSNCFE